MFIDPYIRLQTEIRQKLGEDIKLKYNYTSTLPNSQAQQSSVIINQELKVHALESSIYLDTFYPPAPNQLASGGTLSQL